MEGNVHNHHDPYLGSLHALLPFFSCLTYMTLGLEKDSVANVMANAIDCRPSYTVATYTRMHTDMHNMLRSPSVQEVLKDLALQRLLEVPAENRKET